MKGRTLSLFYMRENLSLDELDIHTEGYTVVNRVWMQYTTLPPYDTTLPLHDKAFVLQELKDSGTSDITEPMTSRGEWKLGVHLIQPQTIDDKTEVQREVHGQHHKHHKKDSHEKRWYVSRLLVMSYLSIVFTKFTSIFIVHKSFLNNSTFFDLLNLYKNNMYFEPVQN